MALACTISLLDNIFVEYACIMEFLILKTRQQRYILHCNNELFTIID